MSGSYTSSIENKQIDMPAAYIAEVAKPAGYNIHFALIAIQDRRVAIPDS
jgi:hypothetical protein